MTALASVDSPARPTRAAAVSASVIIAAVLLSAAVVPLLIQLPHDSAAVDATLPLLAWVALGLAGVVLLDRCRHTALGWSCVAAAATPTVVWLWGTVWNGGESADTTITRVARAWGPLTLVLLGLPPIVAALQSAKTRSDRRWTFWITVSCSATFAIACAAWWAGSPASFGVIGATGIVVVALVIAMSDFIDRPPPIVEPVVDAGLAALGLAVSAGAGWVVLGVARHEQIFGATALSAFATAATAVLMVPAIWWLRSEFLARRYGRGSLTAEEISSLTSDLRTAKDPREILVKASEMVRTSGGLAETSLVLDDVPTPAGWEGRQLLVGDELVGTMLLRPSHPGGLEARQAKVADQLLPTIALVARAVSLAVEASHSRDDLAHQRELERARMLADLHDDLGPLLAGMSMRVAAVREVHGLAVLDDLAAELGACRAELRRIVSGLTPPDLNGGDLATAVARLVSSFDSGTQPLVVLRTEVPGGVEPRASVVVYRAIAEGVTNALKHAESTAIEVSVGRRDGELVVEVCDDGRGGSLVPGVGLQSLRERAEDLGGRLVVGAVPRGGTRLLLTIPETDR